jgi:hypothetical protein
MRDRINRAKGKNRMVDSDAEEVVDETLVLGVPECQLLAVAPVRVNGEFL